MKRFGQQIAEDIHVTRLAKMMLEELERTIILRTHADRNAKKDNEMEGTRRRVGRRVQSEHVAPKGFVEID
jgi:hypothetical protein